MVCLEGIGDIKADIAWLMYLVRYTAYRRNSHKGEIKADITWLMYLVSALRFVLRESGPHRGS
jgi:hypothetical protein